jgi:pSer/pThr/pTyr-binding forkhead associated (FHA) protein
MTIMEENMPTYRLVMRSGPSSGKVFSLEKAELFVGRDLNNDVVANDPEVSRRHARLFKQGNSYTLEDLGSTNGTFINGQRLASPYPLRPGELITFGERINMVFEVTVEDEDATVVSTPARPTEVPYQPPIPPQSQQQVYTPPPPYNPPPQAVRPAPQPWNPPAASQSVQGGYAGQVPDQVEPPKPANRMRMIILIAVILLVVVCLCVAVGLYLAPKEFWCIFPVWEAGACP